MKAFVFLCFCFLLLARICPAQDKQVILPYPSRSAFVAKMAKVELRMTQEQVTTLLGPPDVVNKSSDGSTEWCYGVTPKAECATLGTVEFDNVKKVQRTIGGAAFHHPKVLSLKRSYVSYSIFYGILLPCIA